MLARWLVPALALVAVGACTPEPEVRSADDAMMQVFEVYAHWDEARARLLWGDRAPVYAPRFAWFREQVGACTSAAPIRVVDPTKTRYVFDCERGQIELFVAVRDGAIPEGKGVLEQTLSGVRGVDPPAAVTNMGEALLLTIERPSGERALPELDGRAGERLAEAVAYLEAHGPCHIDRVHLASDTGALFILACEDGESTMIVELDEQGELERLQINPKPLDTWRRTGR